MLEPSCLAEAAVLWVKYLFYEGQQSHDRDVVLKEQNNLVPPDGKQEHCVPAAIPSDSWGSIFRSVSNFRRACCYIQVQHSRMKGKQVTLAHAQQLFAQERETVLVSVPTNDHLVTAFTCRTKVFLTASDLLLCGCYTRSQGNRGCVSRLDETTHDPRVPTPGKVHLCRQDSYTCPYARHGTMPVFRPRDTSLFAYAVGFPRRCDRHQ